MPACVLLGNFNLSEIMEIVEKSRSDLSFAKNVSVPSRSTFRENSPFACWLSFCMYFGPFDYWALGIKPSLWRT
jgi:hypothetical protein